MDQENNSEDSTLEIDESPPNINNKDSSSLYCG